MSPRIFMTGAIGLLWTLAALLTCNAQVQGTSQALKEITDTADRLCGIVATSGNLNSATVKGEVRAELSGLAKRLADLGVSGTGEVSSSSYEGLLQQDLPAALKDIRDCKLKVFNVLQDKLVPGVHSAPGPNRHAITSSKMAWGTLPPDGTPAIAYSIANVGSDSIQDVYASVWLRQPNGLTKLDERQIGYVAQGEFRQLESRVASTPYGQGLLCVSFEHNEQKMTVLNFFASIGEYARYGPMRDMRTARDPITIFQNSEFCRSGVQRAAIDWR